MVARSIRDKWMQRALRVAFAAAIGTLIFQLPLDYLESYTYDWRVAFKPTSPTSGRISTVAVDKQTLKELQKEPTASDHRVVLEKILSLEPTKVVYILNPSELAGSAKEKAELARALGDPRVLVAVDEVPPAGDLDFLKLASPFDRVQILPGPTTTDKAVLAKDGVTRRLVVSNDNQPMYQVVLAQELLGQREEELSGQFKFLKSNQAYIDFHPTGTYRPISLIEIRKGNLDERAITNKIVLIGRDAQDSVKDYVFTPYSREVVAMSVLEMNANSLDTVFMNSAPRLLPSAVALVLTILLSLITVYVVLSVRPLMGLGMLAMSLIGFVSLSHLLFIVFGWWVPMAHPLLATFVCYYFFIPYRLIMENRRSWEYFQKNKLLTQVEELKSNFLRMMSHDLRTPLARIQGMANVVLSDPTPLSENQRRAVETIYGSSEELADFIGSILSLGRIESKEIKLHLKSRDINSLLREVIRKAEFLARKKGVEIRTEFEPMFSFKVDEDLIRQVFTNLLENAIKYSPENGKILVSTEEIDGRAVVQVADQGIGIPEGDLPHVFEKFYRSRAVKQSDISGSGLGLYLVKYFVELHQGQVDVESEASKGSTFTVTLPMVMDTQTRQLWHEGEHHV
jgi:signal transduction histidine kinase